jgi:hypothetical protein
MAALSFYQGLRALGLKSKNPLWICFLYFEGCFFGGLAMTPRLEGQEPFNPLTPEEFRMKLPCEV